MDKAIQVSKGRRQNGASLIYLPGPDVHTRWENNTNSELQPVQTHYESDGHHCHDYVPIDGPADLCQVAHHMSYINPANESCEAYYPNTIRYPAVATVVISIMSVPVWCCVTTFEINFFEHEYLESRDVP